MDEGKQPLRLSRYVWVGDKYSGDLRLELRSLLPDDHPESWPSKVKELTGDPIPDGWRQMLRVPSECL